MKKAQVWISDFLLGFTIMILAILLAHRFIFTNYFIQKQDFNDYLISGQIISQAMISEGIPKNWNISNVLKIGITNGDYTLNISKLITFKNLTETDYNYTKQLFKTNFDYLIYFEDKYGNILNFSKQYYGKPGYDLNLINSSNTENVVSLLRFIVFKSGPVNTSAEIIKMVIYVWQ